MLPLLLLPGAGLGEEVPLVEGVTGTDVEAPDAGRALAGEPMAAEGVALATVLEE